MTEQDPLPTSTEPEAAPEAAAAHEAVPTDTATAVPTVAVAAMAVSGRRRRRIVTLGVLLAGTALLSMTAGYYLVSRKPLPIPDIVTAASPVPHYMYSVYGVDAPTGIAVTPDGNRLYVTQSAGDTSLRVFDGSGATLASAVAPDTDVANRMPVYDAIDPLTGDVYVTDRLKARIDVFDRDGTYLRELTRPATLDAWLPLAIAFDTAGTLYVSDVAGTAHKVHVIDRDGAVVRTIQTELGLQYPNGLALRDDAVYIADSNNGELVRSQGTEAPATLIGRGIGEGDLSLPRALAIDGDDRLYITDVLAHSVIVYQLSSDPAVGPMYVGSVGGEGRENGQFLYPNGVAVDDRGHIYVTDKGNNRVQVWGY